MDSHNIKANSLLMLIIFNLPLAIVTSSAFLFGQKVRSLVQPVTLPYPKSQLGLHSSLEILHPVPDSKLSEYEPLVELNLIA